MLTQWQWLGNGYCQWIGRGVGDQSSMLRFSDRVVKKCLWNCKMILDRQPLLLVNHCPFISVLLCHSVTVTCVRAFFVVSSLNHSCLSQCYSATLLLLLVLVHFCFVSSLNHCMFISLLLSYTSYSVTVTVLVHFLFLFHHWIIACLSQCYSLTLVTLLLLVHFLLFYH